MENVMNYDYTEETPHIISILIASNMLRVLNLTDRGDFLKMEEEIILGQI